MMDPIRGLGRTSILLLGLAVAGCGGDSKQPPHLSQAASMEIFTELLTQIFMVGFGAGGLDAVPADGGPIALLQAQPLATTSITETVACDHGGSVTVSGTYLNTIDAEGNGRVEYDLRSAPNNCGVDTSQGIYRVQGNPHLRITYDLDLAGWQPVGVYTMRWTGGYQWSGPGGSGGCDVDLSYVYDWSNPQAASITGHMCGYQF